MSSSVCIVWPHNFDPPTSLDEGAHIGMFALSAVVGCDSLTIDDLGRIAEYDVIIANQFAKPLCESIKKANPHCALFVSVDLVPQQLSNFEGDVLCSAIADMQHADGILARTHSNASLYSALLEKPAAFLPIPIGTPSFFESVRQTTKQDKVIVCGHGAQAISLATLGLVKTVQRRYDLAVEWFSATEDMQRLGQESGLVATWTPRVVYEDFVRQAASARLAIDLYAAHSVGRAEMTYSYAGTPVVGSTWTECASHFDCDPFTPTQALPFVDQLMNDPSFYANMVQSGIQYVEGRFSFEAVRQQFASIVEGLNTWRV